MADRIARLLDDARVLRQAGDADAARRAFAAAADLARAEADLRLAYALRHLSDLSREAGEADAAWASADEAVRVLREGGDRLDLANALRLRALAGEAPSRPEARTDWAEARDLYLDLGVAAGVAECEAHL